MVWMPRWCRRVATDGPTPGTAVISALNRVSEVCPCDMPASSRTVLDGGGGGGWIGRNGATGGTVCSLAVFPRVDSGSFVLLCCVAAASVLCNVLLLGVCTLVFFIVLSGTGGFGAMAIGA